MGFNGGDGGLTRALTSHYQKGWVTKRFGCVLNGSPDADVATLVAAPNTPVVAGSKEVGHAGGVPGPNHSAGDTTPVRNVGWEEPEVANPCNVQVSVLDRMYGMEREKVMRVLAKFDCY